MKIQMTRREILDHTPGAVAIAKDEDNCVYLYSRKPHKSMLIHGWSPTGFPVLYLFPIIEITDMPDNWEESLLCKKPEPVLADESDIGKEVYVSDIANGINLPETRTLVWINKRRSDHRFCVVNPASDLMTCWQYAYRIPKE